MSFTRLHRRLGWLAAVACAVWPLVGQAHDASSWGGLFRSRDGGATWFQASQGRVVGGALALAINPAEQTFLLLGTDSGLLASRNSGRDWELVGSDLLVGPVLATAFDSAGQRALAATGSGVFRSDDGFVWDASTSPPGSAPARALLSGERPARLYLVGWNTLFRTDDAGQTWTRVDEGLPDVPASMLLLAAGPPSMLMTLIGGQVWASSDDVPSWQPRQTGLPVGHVQTISADPASSATLWAAGTDRLFVSTDRGGTWRQVGEPLPDPSTEIRHIAVDADSASIVLSTHRGLYASRDGATTWSMVTDGLPGHIEAGPLVREPGQNATLYVGFSVAPYDEQWRKAAAGSSSLAELTATELAGAAAFLALLVLGAGLALQWLGQTNRSLAREAAE